MKSFNNKLRIELLKIYEAGGYSSVNSFLETCELALKNEKNDLDLSSNLKDEQLLNIFKSKKGEILFGNSLKWLHSPRNKNKVNLIVTSPPFGLTRKKPYGNKASNEYCAWFRSFAEGFQNVLKEDGSLVIDIAGTWQKGSPVRNLYHFDLLLMLCREYGFHLCQEHYWWNPGRLPSPAQWVNVERSRVKDAVNCIWWLSKSKNPKASNLNIIGAYSKSMNNALRNGAHQGLRPSGHNISKNFNKNNGGSIPPNLLAFSNTESKGDYFDYCRQQELPIHPARFPQSLPEYFIRFLSDKDDLVIDPFGGSSITGYVAEKLGRRWKSIELNYEYALGGIGRFNKNTIYKSFEGKYEIPAPFSHDTL
jgi:DNA modification methylase